jgi:hypothetical protein
MPDASDTPQTPAQMPKAPPVPAFTPVPRQCQRHDGWTPERQRQFIEALADCGSVKAAAHRVGMAPEGAYALRRHPQAKSFRKAWEAALAHGVTRLEDIALERALHGTEVPVYSYGKLVGSRTVHNDRLLMFILRNRAPTRFAADGRAAARRSSINDPAEANRLSRLKAQWRKEWEAEREAEEKSRREKEMRKVDDDIVATVTRMHRRWYHALSPRARDAYRTFCEIEDADRGTWRDTQEPEPLAVVEAEYERTFGGQRPDQSEAHKLVDMGWYKPTATREDAE